MKYFNKQLYSTIFILFLLFFTNNNIFAIENAQEEVKTPDFVDNTTYNLNVMTMDDCIKTALENSPSVKKYRYNYDIAKHNVSIAKSDYFPTIGAGTGYDYQLSKNDMTNISTGAFNVEASLKQLIWNFGRSDANIRMQKFNRITALYNFDKAVLDTIYTVKTNFFKVLAAKASITVAKSNVEINERNYHRTKAYFEEGIKSKIDLVNAEVYLTDSKVSLVTAERAYKEAVIQLNNSMYVAYNPSLNFANTENFVPYSPQIPVEMIEKPSDRDRSKRPADVEDAFLTSNIQKVDIIVNYKFKPFPYTLEECLNIANQNRPDLKAYNSTLKAMKEQVLYVKREFYPNLSGNVGYGYKHIANANSLSAGVTLTSSVNIFKKKHEIDNAKLQVDLAENDINLMKQTIYFEVQKAYVDMVDLEKQIPLQAAKVQHTYENLELADGRYAVGIGDYIELQDAKINYITAQENFILAVFNYNVARANLEKAIAQEQTITKKIEDKT